MDLDGSLANLYLCPAITKVNRRSDLGREGLTTSGLFGDAANTNKGKVKQTANATDMVHAFPVSTQR